MPRRNDDDEEHQERAKRKVHPGLIEADISAREQAGEYERAALLAWIEAVQQEAPGAVMVVVWTHADLLEADAAGKLQAAALEQVKAEIERQVFAVDEAVRQAEEPFEEHTEWSENAQWSEKRALRDAALEALDRNTFINHTQQAASTSADGSSSLDGKEIQEIGRAHV